MKFIRIYTGEDGQSHVDDTVALQFTERDGTRTLPVPATSVTFYDRAEVGYQDFHCPPRRQFLFYLTATVELGFGGGRSVVMEPGDVLMAEDTTGQGHSSRVLSPGLCAIIPIDTDAGT